MRTVATFWTPIILAHGVSVSVLLLSTVVLSTDIVQTISLAWQETLL